jgi:hypothetical protein
MATLDNVFFAFTKIKNPVPAINKANTEFSVACVMSKAAAKAWNTEFKGSKTDAKAIDTEDFEAKYGFEAPFPEQENQYVINIKKMASKDGVPLPEQYRPRAFQKVGSKIVDVTATKLIGNGSKGSLEYSSYSNNFGLNVQLVSILVTDMIEYTPPDEGDGDSSASVAVGSSWGVKELAALPEDSKAAVEKQTAPKKATKADEEEDEAPAKPTKPVKKPKPPVESDEEDDIPY